MYIYTYLSIYIYIYLYNRWIQLDECLQFTFSYPNLWPQLSKAWNHPTGRYPPCRWSWYFVCVCASGRLVELPKAGAELVIVTWFCVLTLPFAYLKLSKCYLLLHVAIFYLYAIYRYTYIYSRYVFILHVWKPRKTHGLTIIIAPRLRFLAVSLRPVWVWGSQSRCVSSRGRTDVD